MPMRQRKLIGAFLIIGFVIFYALLAMALAQARFLQDSAAPVQAVLYAILGFSWIFPLMPLIKWMSGGKSDD
jgi:hypothetical protein